MHTFKKNRTLPLSFLMAGMVLTGCSVSDQAPAPDYVPHTVIAEVIDYSTSPETIEAAYTEDGQDWLRMAFPEESHRTYAVKHIGSQVPNVAYTTMNNQDRSLREIAQPTILYFTDTQSAVTQDMASYMDAFKKEHQDITVITIHPKENAQTVEAFYGDNGYALDGGLTIAGEAESTALTEAFNVKDVPLLVYVDDTQTIAYTAIGFRDDVYLNDHAESAFGDTPFYHWIDAPFGV